MLKSNNIEKDDNREDLRRKKPETIWEKYSTVEFAREAYEDTEEIIKEIHTKAEFPKSELWLRVSCYHISPSK